MTDERHPPEAELARLADGSLPEDRQAELRAEVQRSPELTAALSEQERAVSMLRAFDQPAPAALRARIDELPRPAPPRLAHRRRRWRGALVLPGATALAAVIAAVVILAGGGGTAPTVPQAARLALAAATMPAPGVDRARPGQLSMQGAGIPFPNYAALGFKPDGARIDTIGGRRITTVFYTMNGVTVGYAIASGAPLPGGSDSSPQRYGRFTVERQGRAMLITWVRAGHTCVIAGQSVSPGILKTLADADERLAGGSQDAAGAAGESVGRGGYAVSMSWPQRVRS